MPGRDRKKRRRDGRAQSDGGDIGGNTGRTLQMLDASGRARDVETGEEIPGSPIDVATLMERRKRLEEDTGRVTEDEIMAQLGAPDEDGGRSFSDSVKEVNDDEVARLKGKGILPRVDLDDPATAERARQAAAGNVPQIPEGDTSLILPGPGESPDEPIDPTSDNPDSLRTGVTGITARPSHFIAAQDLLESPSADFDAQLEQRIQDFIENGSNDAPLLNALVSAIEAIDPGNSTRIRERLQQHMRGSRERNARTLIR